MSAAATRRQIASQFGTGDSADTKVRTNEWFAPVAWRDADANDDKFTRRRWLSLVGLLAI